MNIIEFLDSVGHTRLTFQMLHDCISSAKQARGYCNVTFGTAELAPSDLIGTPRKVGVIIWMDNSDYERARLAAAPTGEAP